MGKVIECFAAIIASGVIVISMIGYAKVMMDLGLSPDGVFYVTAFPWMFVLGLVGHYVHEEHQKHL